jgi:hypothetical protein
VPSRGWPNAFYTQDPAGLSFRERGEMVQSAQQAYSSRFDETESIAGLEKDQNQSMEGVQVP